MGKILLKSTPIFFFLAGLSLLSFNHNKNSPTQYPVNFWFRKPAPPDSIQTFFAPYLQSKKIKIISQEEMRRLAGEEINKQAMAILESRDRIKRKLDNLSDYLNQVGTTLIIQVSNNKADTNNYFIDSIGWQVASIPPKDTISAIKRMYVPENSKEENPYIILKAFLDHVLNSGYLK